MKQFCLSVGVAIGLALPAFGQGVDPIVGTWKGNMEKSTWTDAPFKSITLTIVGEGQNFTNTAYVWQQSKAWTTKASRSNSYISISTMANPPSDTP